MRSFGKNWSKSTGQAVLEAALVMPVLALIILGIVELGYALTSHMTIDNVAREAARIAARGGIYPDSDILDLVTGNSGPVDLVGHGSVVVTEVTSKTGTFTSYETRTILGTGTSKLSESDLSAMHSAASSSDPAYLGTDKFVVVELFYDHRTITGFLGQDIRMYSNAIMPVSAPS